MSFEVRSQLGPSRAPEPDARSAPARKVFLGSFTLYEIAAVTEVGCRSGMLASELFSLKPGSWNYFGLEGDPFLLGLARAKLQTQGDRASLILAEDGGILPLPDASQDILYCGYYLEHLRKDHLYMICSEARRIVKNGGIWAILAHAPPLNFVERLSSALQRGPTIELDHFFSPEDWLVEADQRSIQRGFISRWIHLRRIGE